MQTFKAESSDRLLGVLFDGDSHGKQYQKDVAVFVKRLGVKQLVLENGLAIEDYCRIVDIFLEAVELTLRGSYEAMDKKVPPDINASIKSSWDEFNQNRVRLQTKEKKQPEVPTLKTDGDPAEPNQEVTVGNAGAWFKLLSTRLIDNGSSKAALARNYAFISRERGVSGAIDPKRLQTAKGLVTQIIESLMLPSQKAKKEIEGQR